MKTFSKLKIFWFIKCFLVSFVGVVIKYIRLLLNFHNTLLKIFNFGRPDILKINLVLKLKNKNRIIGSEVIK